MLKVANSVISASRITGVLPVANGGTNASTASITSFNNITGFTASGTTGTTSTNLVFATTPTLVGDVTLSTGNLVIGTSGKGIDFSATSHPAGMTSELLADYEEGTWTPTDQSGASLSFSSTSGNCFYTKVGNLVTCIFSLTYPSTADTSTAGIGGLPFTAKATSVSVSGGVAIYISNGAAVQALLVGTNQTIFYPRSITSMSGFTNLQLSTAEIRGIITYTV